MSALCAIVHNSENQFFMGIYLSVDGACCAQLRPSKGGRDRLRSQVIGDDDDLNGATR